MGEREAEQQNQQILSSSHLICEWESLFCQMFEAAEKIKKKKDRGYEGSLKILKFSGNGSDFEGDYFFAFSPYCSPVQNALCLLIPRGAWWATVHGVAELDMIEWLHRHTCPLALENWTFPSTWSLLDPRGSPQPTQFSI